MRHKGGLTPKERPNLGSSFYMFDLLPLSLPYINWASQEGGLFHEVLPPVLGFSFVPFSRAFSFLFLLVTAILDSFFLF